MPLVPLAPPLINGSFFDWSSIEIRLGLAGRKFTGAFKSISYKGTQTPGKVFGNGVRQKIGRTPGQHDASGSFEMYRSSFLDFQSELQGVQAINNLSVAPGIVPGLYEVNFNMSVSFSEGAPQGATFSLTSMPTQTDSLIGCRIVDCEFSGSAGNDAATVKCELDIMYVAFNKAIPVNQLLQAGQIG